jgi:hypothetical protein
LKLRRSIEDHWSGSKNNPALAEKDTFSHTQTQTQTRRERKSSLEEEEEAAAMNAPDRYERFVVPEGTKK